jgi:hypothetical protein
MSKNKYALVTIAVGDFYQELAQITHPTLKRYADKIGADFIVWDQQKNHAYPHYLKLEIGQLLKEYERVVYVDSDIIIREDSPNILNLVPPHQIGMFDEGRFIPERGPVMAKYLQSFGIDPRTWNGKYYNSGVMVFSNVHQLLFMKPIDEGDNFYEQTHINMMLHLLKAQVFDIPYKFNRMCALDAPTGEDRRESYFVHYAGLNLAMPKDNFFAMVKADLESWEKCKPEYKYPNNILIEVEGGMGDQIDAEPTVRKLKENMYPLSNFVVVTDFPEAFTHIDGVQVFKRELTVRQKIPPFGYFEMETMKKPEHPSWRFASHALCHGVDFAATQCLKGPLPLKERSIKLKTDFDAVVKFLGYVGQASDLVLVHAGRGWDSKTFPADVWESYIQAIQGMGYRVALIGKRTNKEQGVVELNLDNISGVIDLVDKLSVKEMFAAISLAPVLLSNDSSPIHVAGAFDNWIGVIATCKHPELILPYRNGSVYHKAEALEKEPMYDQYKNYPTYVDGATIDWVPGGDIRKYLPDVDTIKRFIKNAFADKE